jgi:hypothetical protein
MNNEKLQKLRHGEKQNGKKSGTANNKTTKPTEWRITQP